MEIATKHQDGAKLSEEQDVAENGWNPDEIAKHASMSKVEVIHLKAKMQHWCC